jgi:flagellar hook-associated protein 3 FlgL
MTRVSTSGSYASVLSNLMSAQQRQVEAGDQLSSGKVGTDLKAYSRDAQVLTAMQTLNTRLTAFTDQNIFTSNRLETQDLGLNKAAEAADNTRKAIANAIAANNAAAFMTSVRGEFANAIGAFNTQYAGKFVFAGGQVNTRPVSATRLEDLTLSPTAVADSFENDDYIDRVRVDETTILEIGQVADDLGTAALNAFRDIQAFQEGANGPFTGTLTAAQKTFLESQLTVWDSVHKGLVEAAARNGVVQSQLDGVESRLTARQTTVQGMIGDISDADMAKAATALTQAQQAVQASSQVFITLKNVSLLNFLQ